MLADIQNDVYSIAKEYITDNSKYEPFVTSHFVSDPQVFPIVCIEEVDDVLSNETLKNGEQKLKLTYEIEIYAMDKTAVQTKVARQEIINELKKLVNDVFDETLGFRRTASRPRANIDLDVARHYMRFEGVYDTTNNKIFRR